MLDLYYGYWDGWGVVPTFTFSPSFSPSCTRSPRVLSIKFGDGYEQRSPDGIHADLQSWVLTFDHCPVAEADAIEAFFTANTTWSAPFSWTPPRAGSASKFICRSWRRTVASPTTDSIAVTFDQVMDP